MANTTWSTTDKTANATISGGGLITTFSAANAGVRAVDRQISGKHYWETTFTTASGAYGVGLAVADATLGILYSTPFNALMVYATGTIWVNNVSLGSLLGSLAAGGVVVGHALDATGKWYWARNASTGGFWNGSATANPATGVGGIPLTGGLATAALYPAACAGTGPTVVTANFGDAGFAAAAPAGFTAGFTAGAVIPLNEMVFGLVRETIGASPGELRVQSLVRETIGAPVGLLQVQSLVREAIVAPGIGQNRVLVQGLVREVIVVPGAAGGGPKQYAVTVIT